MFESYKFCMVKDTLCTRMSIINKIKSLYLSLVGDEFELANKFNNILDMIWGFLRFIYNSYNREHKLSKNYK